MLVVATKLLGQGPPRRNARELVSVT